jgi:hypothetical protein
MKKLLFMLVLMISTFSFAQSRATTILVQGKSPKWDISQIVTNKTDTVVYFYMGYQNQKYTHISDIGSIMLSSKAVAEEFVKALREIAEVGAGTDYDIRVHNFSVSKYNFTSKIFISDKNEKYTTLTKTQVLNLANSVEANLHLFLR